MAMTGAERIRKMRERQKAQEASPASVLRRIEEHEAGGMPYEELIHTPEFKALEEAQHNADLLKSIRAAMRGAGSPYERMKAVSYLIDLSDKADAFQNEE